MLNILIFKLNTDRKKIICYKVFYCKIIKILNSTRIYVNEKLNLFDADKKYYYAHVKVNDQSE